MNRAFADFPAIALLGIAYCYAEGQNQRVASSSSEIIDFRVQVLRETLN